MLFRFILLLCLATGAQALDIDSLWDYEHPAISESRFRQALASPDIDAATQAALLTQIARAQGMQGQFAKGNQALDTVQNQLPALPPLVSVRYMLERGRILHGMGEVARAWRWYHSALLLAQKDDLEIYAIDAMHMLALTATGRAALDWNLKALAVAEHSTTPQAANWMASLYNNIGWLYLDLKDNAHALEYLRKAQAWHEQHDPGKPLLIARWSVARALRLSGEYDKALAIDLDLERAWTKLGEEDGYVYEEIAECMLALDRVADAKPYFSMAYTTLSKDAWLVQHEAARLNRLKTLSH